MTKKNPDDSVREEQSVVNKNTNGSNWQDANKAENGARKLIRCGRFGNSLMKMNTENQLLKMKRIRRD